MRPGDELFGHRHNPFYFSNCDFSSRHVTEAIRCKTSFQRAALATLCWAAAAFAQTATEGSIQLVGVVSYPVSAGATPAVPQAAHNLARVTPYPNLRAAFAKAAVAAPGVALSNPDPAPKAVSRPDEGFAGFGGLNHVDNTMASNGTQFSAEPPDRGLAVGNGYVFEAVNSVVAVYSKKGVLQAPPVALNAFFGLAPEIIPSTPPVFGPNVLDPRVYYDRELERWFLTVTELDTDSGTGAPTGPSHVFLAVSQTANPTGVVTSSTRSTPPTTALRARRATPAVRVSAISH